MLLCRFRARKGESDRRFPDLEGILAAKIRTRTRELLSELELEVKSLERQVADLSGECDSLRGAVVAGSDGSDQKCLWLLGWVEEVCGALAQVSVCARLAVVRLSEEKRERLSEAETKECFAMPKSARRRIENNAVFAMQGQQQ